MNSGGPEVKAETNTSGKKALKFKEKYGIRKSGGALHGQPAIR